MRNVLNTLRVLEEVAARQPVGVGELARELGIPKSSVQRALVTLNTAGWIRPSADELTRWVMTSKALTVGGQVSLELDLRKAALPIMEELRRSTDETIHLAVPEEDRVVLIERLETSKPVRIIMALGHAFPLHASANGKAILAHGRPEMVNRMLVRELPRFTETTIDDASGLRAELALIRERGFAVNRGEWRSDVGCVASAVLGAERHPIASMSVNLPVSRMSSESEAYLGAAVRDAARELSVKLGY